MKRRSFLSVETLESRRTPSSVTYSDIDGDTVTITASTGPLDPTDLTLFAGQLRFLTLTDPGFQGASISFAVAKSATGDGLADVGRINATGNDLGIVTVKGDLGVIDAGNGDPAVPAIKALSVRSMGRYGLASQGELGDLESNVFGRLGSLKVTGDIKDAFIDVSDGVEGTIGSVTIGGSLLGGSGADSGRIDSTGDIGPVKIGRDASGRHAGQHHHRRIVSRRLGLEKRRDYHLRGHRPREDRPRPDRRGDSDSGRISSLGKLASITIGGSLLGGSGAQSGVLQSDGDMGIVKIGRDVIGNAGDFSGCIFFLNCLEWCGRRCMIEASTRIAVIASLPFLSKALP